MRMMVTTTAGKRDKNNELCVQIWRRVERRSTKKKSTHTLHKRCYNNRIDNNNVVQRVGVDVVVVVDFLPLSKNELQILNMQNERKGPKNERTKEENTNFN